MKTFLEFINESIVDRLQPTLSPQIFDFPESSDPRLKPFVQKQIKKDLESISKEVQILDAVLVGSILTRRYRYDTDLDIHILAKGKTDQEMSDLAKKLSERRIDGTFHPVNYYIISSKKDHDRSNALADGEFDPIKNVFRRNPNPDLPFDVTQYFSTFQEKVKNINQITMELRHDLIDYNQLKLAPKNELKRLQGLIENHLKSIEKDAKELIDIYNQIRQGRKTAFETDVTADEIRQYGSKNRTPGNVLFKLMEKYHYLQFLKKVKEIVGDDLKISDSEVKKLSKLIIRK